MYVKFQEIKTFNSERLKDRVYQNSSLQNDKIKLNC